MNLLLLLSEMIIPMTFVIIIVYGMLKKVSVYDTFIVGAKDGFGLVIRIIPTIIGLMVAVGILEASGFFDIIVNMFRPLAQIVAFPVEAIPLTFMRLVSSSASNGLLINIFKEYGPDSFMGRFVSIMMSCTETVFYTMSIYFLSVKVTKTRYTLAGALFANFIGVFASLFITVLTFGR